MAGIVNKVYSGVGTLTKGVFTLSWPGNKCEHWLSSQKISSGRSSVDTHKNHKFQSVCKLWRACVASLDIKSQAFLFDVLMSDKFTFFM